MVIVRGHLGPTAANDAATLVDGDGDARCGFAEGAGSDIASTIGHRGGERMRTPDPPNGGDEPRQGYAVRQIRRCNRHLFLVNTAVLVAVALLGASNMRYLYNFFLGPFPADRTGLLNGNDMLTSTKYFVTFAADRILPTGVHDLKQERDSSGALTHESILADYQVALIDQKLMLIRTDPGSLPQPLRGAIVAADTGAVAAVRTSVAKSHPELRGNYLATMLDASEFRTPGYVAFLICAPLALVALWNLGKAVLRGRDIRRHPSMRVLMSYGPLPDLLRDIDGDVGLAPERLGTVTVTRSWVLAADLYRFHAVPMRELAWAYSHQTRRTQFPVKVSGVILFDRARRKFALVARGRSVDRLLELIGERAPWAFVGYDSRLDQASKGAWHSMVATVDRRRSERQSGAPPAA
jgi:hypothetical protein